MIKPKTSPFIIWTLRRAGGTNLASLLFQKSSFPTVEHEPFNGDRQFGDITKNWQNYKDKENLYKALDNVLKHKPNIKHCFEIIPSEINSALLEVSEKYGYKHLFLFREYPINRLLSLNYAKQTGIWGANKKGVLKGVGDLKSDVDVNVFDTPISIDELIAHEKMCRHKMKDISSQMIKKGIKPLSLTFESIYQASLPYSRGLVQEIFRELGLVEKDLFRGNDFKKIFRGKGQNTKDDYLKFPRAELFVSKCKNFKRLILNELFNYKVERASLPDEIKHFELWSLQPAAKQGYAIVSGILVSSKHYNAPVFIVLADGMKVVVHRGLESPRMAEKYQDYLGSDKAMFFSEPFRMESFDIKLGSDILLASIKFEFSHACT